MKFNILTHDIFPFFLGLAALVAAAIAADGLLHVMNAVWVGRYLGIPGVLLIVASLSYSLRKRRLIATGNPALLLKLHERMAWAGCLLVLVHAGIHFDAILAWLAVGALLINVGSGLTGKFLLQRSRRRLDALAQPLRMQGLTGRAIEQRLYWDSLTFDVVKQWREVHYPVTLAFSVLAIAHIASIFVFWRWK
jgi:hypothetical protein